MTLEAYFLDNRDRLHGLALRLTGDPHAAEDVLQQALVRTLGAVGRGEEISTWGAWLYRVIHNLATNYHQSENRRPVPLEQEDTLFSPSPEPPELAALHDNHRAIFEVMNDLPKRQREALLLTAVRGLNYDETATVLGTSTSSVRQSVYRARRAVRAGVGAGRRALGFLLPWFFGGGRSSDGRSKSGVGVRLSGWTRQLARSPAGEQMLHAAQVAAPLVVAAALVVVPTILLGHGAAGASNSQLSSLPGDPFMTSGSSGLGPNGPFFALGSTPAQGRGTSHSESSKTAAGNAEPLRHEPSAGTVANGKSGPHSVPWSPSRNSPGDHAGTVAPGGVVDGGQGEPQQPGVQQPDSGTPQQPGIEQPSSPSQGGGSGSGSSPTPAQPTPVDPSLPSNPPSNPF